MSFPLHISMQKHQKYNLKFQRFLEQSQNSMHVESILKIARNPIQLSEIKAERHKINVVKKF